MKWFYKSYDELNKKELYDILHLRAEVFVIEQDCPYQDVDNKDQKAIHVYAVEGDEMVAYARIFQPGDYFQEASIGRVVTKSPFRGTGLGQEIMQLSIKYVEENIQPKTLRISAQEYLKNFYSAFGFKQIGDSYLEDGIPHIGMLRCK